MSTPKPSMTAPPHVYRERRRRLAAVLARPLLLLAGRARGRQYATNLYPFRAGSHYLYFGGPPLEGAAWLIEPGSDGNAGCTLLRPEIGVDDRVWFGEVASDVDMACVAGLATNALQSPDRLGDLMCDRVAGFLAPPCIPSLEWMKAAKMLPANEDEMRAIVDLRLIKDDHERTAMRRAARISVEGQRAAVGAARPGATEADVHAALMAVYLAAQGAPSFTPIITVRGEALHCEVYPNRLQPGALLLIDAGAEEPGGYASDMTRTVPIGGAFSTIQRQLYDTVLRAQRAAIAACLPGARYRDVHDVAAKIICEGLVTAGLLRGDPAQLAERRAHTLFFVHGIGHLIGLDVHDMEDFGDVAGYAPGRQRRTPFGDKFLRLDRDLAPGMALTIEPGIYIVPAIWEHPELPVPFADVVNRGAVEQLLAGGFGGIRIEESIIIGEPGAAPEVLTGAMPADAEAITPLVGRS